MSHLIGMDMGTSSVKAILMTEDGKVQKVARGAFEYTKLASGGVEISAESYAKVCIDVIKELSDYANGDVKAICASSASGNLLVLDKENKPLTGIINWQDKRVGNEAKEVFDYLNPDEFYNQIGWPFGYKAFPLAQMAYIKKNSPEVIKNAGKVCMSTEYLYFLLTGKWGISTSAGTPFFFIDQQKKEYIPHLLETLGVSEDMFPPVMDAAKTLGGILPQMTDATGLKEGTPVVLGTFDHPSAARGVGVLKEGQVLLSCGTSWVGFFPIKDRQKIADAKMLIDPFLAPQGGCWAGMTSVASISERIWLYVSTFIDDGKDAFNMLSSLAKKAKKGAGGLKINPKDEPNKEEILRFSKENIARAIMEGTVNLLKERLDMLKEKGIGATEGIMVGGPSEDPYWIELIEDMTGIKLSVIHGQYAGAVGAATMAGIGAGLFENEEKAFEYFNK
ncbi:MAG: FGGY-family carbohydrate kinase [Clostridia bacterium]|nr:FGGY-family carbohydrate kinase [Clostridia bacterium]